MAGTVGVAGWAGLVPCARTGPADRLAPAKMAAAKADGRWRFRVNMVNAL